MQVSANSERIRCGTAIGHGLTPWGTPIAVQQKLMRHADIRTTMNVYGDIVTDEMTVASGKVAGLALNGR
jgi:integrase